MSVMMYTVYGIITYAKEVMFYYICHSVSVCLLAALCKN